MMYTAAFDAIQPPYHQLLTPARCVDQLPLAPAPKRQRLAAYRAATRFFRFYEKLYRLASLGGTHSLLSCYAPSMGAIIRLYARARYYRTPLSAVEGLLRSASLGHFHTAETSAAESLCSWSY